MNQASHEVYLFFIYLFIFLVLSSLPLFTLTTFIYATITLAPTLANSTVTFKVNYHASPEPDYLVLASKFRHAMHNSHLWQPSRHFRMYYSDEGKFYYGQVQEFEQMVPGSWWEALSVKWYEK
jgi:hypothetical protein